MNDCAKYLRRISAFHDGELPPEAEHEVREHLAGCESCRLELERLAALSEVIRSKTSEWSPPAFKWPADGRTVRRNVIIRFAVKWSAAAAAILVVCLVRLVLLNGAETEPLQAWERVAVLGRSAIMPPIAQADRGELETAMLLVGDTLNGEENSSYE